MNENTEKTEDRFHKEEVIGDSKYVQTVIANSKKKSPRFYEFAPEPMHMIEARRANLKFTVGKKYEEMERKELSSVGSFSPHYILKLIDDEGNEKTVDEKYFIVAGIPLCGEKEVGGWEPKMLDNGLPFESPDMPEIRPDKSKCFNIYGDMEGWKEFTEEVRDDLLKVMDIRKKAEEVGVKPLESNDDFKDMKILAGVKDNENPPPFEDYQRAADHRKSWYHCQERARKKVRGIGYADINEGVVKDDGNELMYDATKCMEAVNNVFGSYKFDSDELLSSIQNHVHGHTMAWENGFLTIDGVKTKIDRSKVQEALTGLQFLVSEKQAREVVAKLVASKLKKIF